MRSAVILSTPVVKPGNVQSRNPVARLGATESDLWGAYHAVP